MQRVFADAHFFIAFLSQRDVRHERAVEAYRSGDFEEIVTTAWVLTELADGMSRVGSRSLCQHFIERLREEKDTRIIEADPKLFWRGFDLYCSREDKEWSLTDCISFVAMADEQLSEALTGDHHFEQAGFVVLLR